MISHQTLPYTEGVLLGGPEDGRIVPLYGNGICTTVYWKKDEYLYSFTENERQYYIHNSEVNVGHFSHV